MGLPCRERPRVSRMSQVPSGGRDLQRGANKFSEPAQNEGCPYQSHCSHLERLIKRGGASFLRSTEGRSGERGPSLFGEGLLKIQFYDPLNNRFLFFQCLRRLSRSIINERRYYLSFRHGIPLTYVLILAFLSFFSGTLTLGEVTR